MNKSPKPGTMPKAKAAAPYTPPVGVAPGADDIESLLAGLEDMIDGERIGDAEIPNDFTWLESIIYDIRKAQYRAAGQSPEREKSLLKEATQVWEDEGDSDEYKAVMRKVRYYLSATNNLGENAKLPAKLNALYALMQIYNAWSSCGDSDDHDLAVNAYAELG